MGILLPAEALKGYRIMAGVWKKVTLTNRDGKVVPAVAPVIISASRSTDVPAFYADWFCNRLNAGYCVWMNPHNGVRQYVSFQDARAIVFWSKHPAPLLKHLPLLDGMGLGYYFQFTLNDYDEERLEPGVPSVEKRIALFKQLSLQMDRRRVVWRFDPLLITRQTPPERLLSKVIGIGEELHDYAERLVISFADISAYSRVERKLRVANLGAREFREDEMRAFATSLTAKTRQWGLDVRTCAESVDLSACGVLPNKCIDDDLLAKWFSNDIALMTFLGKDESLPGLLTGHINKLKDKGQRKACGCIVSKDIGLYNTCPHLCLYCYANQDCECVRRAKRHSPDSECILDN